jgi:hypothetical protein
MPALQYYHLTQFYYAKKMSFRIVDVISTKVSKAGYRKRNDKKVKIFCFEEYQQNELMITKSSQKKFRIGNCCKRFILRYERQFCNQQNLSLVLLFKQIIPFKLMIPPAEENDLEEII